MMTTTASVTLEQLHKVEVFEGFSDEQLNWFLQHGEYQEYGVNAIIGKQNDASDYMYIILEGVLEFRQGDNVFRNEAGRVTGMLPFSRLTKFAGTGTATEPLKLLRVHKKDFMDMLQTMPELGQRLVGLMIDRAREFSKLELRQEKLMSLGKLSAGLAHELNNPAAAAQRSAAQLSEAILELETRSAKLGAKIGVDGLEKLVAYLGTLQYKPLTALERSEHEDELTEWLEDNGAQNAYEWAATWVDAGADIAWVDGLHTLKYEVVSKEAMPEVVAWLEATLRTRSLVNVIKDSSERISGLVKAIKSYTYMDQAAKQDISVQDGLETTLSLFAYKFKKGVTVERDYAPDLPKISAFGSELNQVWTNLIDNAIDAMNGQGVLRVKTRLEPQHILVEIGDNGPGIPEDVHARIFEPFFTTKEVGKGTGLGLDTVRQIIKQHGGSIHIESKPGDTRFQIHLPL
ncbi:MAG: ATP-binding protein [Trueperaceae bacterium]